MGTKPTARIWGTITIGMSLLMGCGSEKTQAISKNLGPVKATTDAQAADSPCTPTTKNDRDYLFCATPQVFVEAKAHCEAFGMTLATIDNADENAFVAASLPGAAYVGLTDREREGVWRGEADRQITWCGDASGRRDNPSIFTNWRKGSPISTQCALHTFEEHDYWACSDAVTWEEAKLTCQERGGDLASIGAATENATLANWIDSPTWLGGRASSDDDWWAWDDTGDKFWEGGRPGRAIAGAYTNWESGAPRGASSHACMLMSNGRNGYWKPADCGQRKGFVCKSPKSKEPHQPDRHNCAAIHPDGTWTNTTCDAALPYVCEKPSPTAGLQFSGLSTAVRDDYRSGKRRVSHAEFNGVLSATDMFSRFPEELGLRPCVDSLAETGSPRQVRGGLEAQGYEQTYHGLPVYTRGYAVKRDPITKAARSLTGRLAHDIEVKVSPTVSEHAARMKAADTVGAKAAHYSPTPAGRLVIFPSGFGPEPQWRLAWLFVLPRLPNVASYTVAIGADAPDVFMVSNGDIRAQCKSIDVSGVPLNQSASVAINPFQRDIFGDPNTALAVSTGNGALPYALVTQGVDTLAGSPLASAPKLYAACGGESYPRVAALDRASIDVLEDSPIEYHAGALFMAAQRVLEANAATFSTMMGNPWVGIDGAGGWDVQIRLLPEHEASGPYSIGQPTQGTYL